MNKKGKTISITIPLKLERFFQKEADRIGISRSRIINNILLKYYEQKIIRRGTK